MNKIKVLIDNGFITDNDIHEYISSNQDFYEMANYEPEYPDNDDYQQMIHDHEQQEQLELEAANAFYDKLNSEYIIASTSVLLQETMVFPADKEGKITDYGDLVCIALRNGHDDWADAMAAVITLNTDEYKYIHVKTINGKNIHNLFKRINVKDNIVI